MAKLCIHHKGTARMNVARIAITFGLLVFALSSSITAQEMTSLTKIQETAEEYVAAFYQIEGEGEFSFEARPLDNRLAFAACALPLAASAPPNRGTGRQITVKVSCPENGGWNVYVPVRITQYQAVVVASNALEMNEMLGPHNLEIEQMEANTVRGAYFSDLSMLEGAKMLRRHPAGQPVRPSNVCQICVGDSVTIIASGHGIELKTNGQALSHGNIGDTIKVRNSQSNRQLDARILRIGVVAVSL